MNLLIIGGAGHVGTILRPALEANHTCRYYDRNPIPEVGDRCIVADVNDDEAIERALPGTDAIVYLAMGSVNGQNVGDINLALDVNVRGAYRFMHHALKAGVRRIVYASSLSVYSGDGRKHNAPLDERIPADAWEPYGMSKRLGENVCQAAVQRYPDATAVALRLMRPMNDEQWAEFKQNTPERKHFYPTGPEDMRRLFLAAIDYSVPGAHIIQASGDIRGELYSNALAGELLGWQPRGE